MRLRLYSFVLSAYERGVTWMLGAPKGARIFCVASKFDVLKGAHGKRLQHAREMRHEGASFYDVTEATDAPKAQLFLMLHSKFMRH
ncbi:hypothetical protein KI387_040605, partial [Taxus chinensis]